MALLNDASQTGTPGQIGTVAIAAETIKVTIPQQVLTVTLPAYSAAVALPVQVPGQTVTLNVPSQTVPIAIPAQTDPVTGQVVQSGEMDYTALAKILMPILKSLGMT